MPLSGPMGDRGTEPHYSDVGASSVTHGSQRMTDHLPDV